MIRFFKNVLFSAFWVCASLAFSGEEQPEVRQITTYPQADFGPTVSRDGKWLAFVSERSGNLDIWMKRMPNGETVQVTTHQADDLEPAWSPDGRRLVFVSKRRDAQGDLWMVKIDPRKDGRPIGEPVQLTTHLGLDRKPSFSPDGKKIVYVSDEGGIQNLWIYDIATKHTEQLTRNGGIDPAWSADGRSILFTSYLRDPGGDLFLIELGKAEGGRDQIQRIVLVTEGPALDGQAAWSPKGDRIAFVRRDADTDGDGRITPQDRGHVWVKILKNSEDSLKAIRPCEFQLTPALYDDGEPAWSADGRIYFSSTRSKSLDIWSSPENGILNIFPSAAEQASAVEERFVEAQTEEALDQEVLEYRKAAALFPKDSVRVARSLIRIGEINQILKKEAEAQQTFNIVRSQYAGQKREAGMALLRIAALKVEPLEDRVRYCRDLVSSEETDPNLRAEACILLGDLLLETGDKAGSFGSYSKVLSQFPNLRYWRAQALLRIGDFFQADGQIETANQSYFSVLREFGEVPLWRDRAGQRLLAQVRGTPEEKLERFQKMIQDFSDYPSLMAEAQFAIVRILIQRKQLDVALRELERVEELVPNQTWALARSKIVQAEVNRLRGDDLRGIFLLESVIQDYGMVEGGRFVAEAKDVLFDLCLDSAERLKVQGDYFLATSRYQKALDLRPNEIKVHRGLIETYARLGKIDQKVQSYSEQVKREPKNPSLLYGLGLSLSYQGERDSEALKKSNTYLLQSLDEDYRIVYPYRTLGYNYEVLEHLAELKRTKRQPFLIRTAKTLLSPVSWVLGALPFHKRKTESGYTEKAIQVLITAMELNDERLDPAMETALTQNLANNFYNLGEFGFAKAFQYYQNRLAADTAFSSLLEKAVFYERAGHAALYLDETESSAKFLSMAVQTYTQLGREEDALRSIRRRAWLWQQAGKYEDAVQEYQTLAEKDERSGRWMDLELDYRNIAYNYYLLEEDEDALKYGLKAEKILATQDIPKGPPEKSYLRVGIFGFTIPVWGMEEIGGASAEGFTLADEQAFVTGLLSRSCESLKKFQESVSYEQKRLDLFRKRKDRIAERICLNRLGMLRYKMADYDSAWTYFELSLQASKKHKDVRGQWTNAVNLGNVAIVSRALHDSPAYLGGAKNILVTITDKLSEDPSVSLRDRIAAQTTLGDLIFFLSEGIRSNRSDAPLGDALKTSFEKIRLLEQADNHYQKALDLAKQGGFWREQAILYKNVAEVYQRSGDDIEALRAVRESHQILSREGDEELLWRVESAMAKLVQKVPQKADSILNPSALDLYRQAMNRLEFLPVEEEGSEEELSDRTERRDLYFDAAAAMVRSGLVREALETAERGREKNIADMLSRHPPALRKERHKIAWGNLRYVRSVLSDKRRQLLVESTGTRRPTVLERLKKEEQVLFDDYKNQLWNLESEDRLLAYLAGAMKIDLDTLRSSLPPNGAVLYYWTGEDNTLMWFVSRDTLLSTTIPGGRLALEKLTDRLHETIQKDSLVQADVDSLFRTLIGPVDVPLKTCRMLAVIPDGMLWKAPFGFLFGSENRFDSLTLTYAPSFAFLALSRDKRKINQETGVLVGDLRDQALIESMKAAGIRKKTLLGPEATEKGFKEALEQTDLVQAEKWILGYENDPLASALVFNPGKGEDGYCRADELFSLDARANLVFLPPYGGGILQNGYPEIFFYGLLYAGAPSVVTSLWSADRPAKQIFLDTFYRNIQAHSFAEALGRAVRAVRSAYPAARNWTGFRLVGFPGMNTLERIAFAEENQVQMILQSRYLEEKGEFADAVSTFEKALVLTEAIRDSASVPKIDQEIVRVAMKGKLWPKAIQYQENLIEFNQKTGNENGLLNGFKNLVVFYLQNGDYTGASKAKSRQIELLKQAGKTKDLAPVCEEMAFIEAGRRRFGESVSWIEEALRLYNDQGDSNGQARAFVLKGRFYLEGDDAWKAKACLEQGTARLDSILISNPQNEKIRYDLASGIQLLGLTCEKLTLYDEAITHQDKAISLFQNLSRPIQVAQGNQYLANIYWKTGNYRMAFSYQNKTLELLQSSDNKKLLAMAYGTQGLIHLSLGDLVQAKLAEEKALDIVGQEAAFQADRAAILKNRGLIALQEKNLDQAYGYFRQAEAIDSSLGLKTGLAYDYRNLGNVLIKNRHEKEGLSLLKAAMDLSRSLGDIRNTAQCRYGLAQGYALFGNIKAALAALDTGLSETGESDFPDLQWRLSSLRGRLLVQTGKEKEALDNFQKAIDIVEAMRGELKIEAFQQGFFDDKMDLYEDAIRLMLRAGRSEEAFHFAERAKSRNFVDILANQSVAFPKAQGDMLQKERQADQSVQEAQDQLSRALQVKGEITTDVQAQRQFWATELERRRKTYHDVLAEIQAGNPELASFVSVDPWSAGKIQTLLPDSTALIEYFATHNSLFMWILKKNALRWKELQIPSADLQIQVRQFRDAIQSHLSTDLEAKKLYSWLVEPVAGEISGIRHLILVPHGVLHYLPFSALEDDQGEFLVERFSISNAPSATVLGFCLEKASRIKSDAYETGGVFAVSNPDLGDARYDLPFAEKEVKSLRRTFNNVSALFGKDATVQGVEDHLPNAKAIIHFACHAEYAPEAPLFSALRLAPEPSDDGRLDAQAIFGLPFQCGLVTLSACETGLAKVTRGDEIVGLARSFIFAGTPSVMTSLWKVDDLATAVLMKRFYRNLKAGYSKAEALRKAQMLVKNVVNAHPAAWAAFCLTGDFK